MCPSGLPPISVLLGATTLTKHARLSMLLATQRPDSYQHCRPERWTLVRTRRQGAQREGTITRRQTTDVARVP